jgi:hypothetical protein
MRSVSLLLFTFLTEPKKKMSKLDDFAGTVLDREERKRQRKKRIDKSNSNEISNVDEGPEKEQGSNKTGAQQVVESLFHLDHK